MMIKPDEVNKLTPEQIGILICVSVQMIALLAIIYAW